MQNFINIAQKLGSLSLAKVENTRFEFLIKDKFNRFFLRKHKVMGLIFVFLDRGMIKALE